MLEEVRYPLLEEARRSLTLLSDLAGLERYIAESYDASRLSSCFKTRTTQEQHGLLFNGQAIFY